MKLLTIFAIMFAMYCYAEQKDCEILYEHTEMGAFDKIKVMVEKNNSLASCASKWGFTPLHGIVSGHGMLWDKDIEIALYLISKGANVEAKNDSGVTPLHIAAYPGMVKLLVENGAGVETTDNSGGTALLYYAEAQDSLPVMEEIIKLGANVNHADDHGKTALDIARSRNELSKINLLVKHGAK